MEDQYNDNVTWTHYTSTGRIITDNTTAVAAIEYSKAVVTAENGDTATYYVYQGTAATGDDLAEDILAAIDLTDEKEVAEAVATLKAESIYYSATVQALDDADAPVDVFVPVLLDEYADENNASNNESNNAALAQKLINNVDTKKQNAAAAAYVDWLIDELAATDSSVTNADSVVIKKTADGKYDIQLKAASAPSNTGLIGLLNELDSSATPDLARPDSDGPQRHQLYWTVG